MARTVESRALRRVAARLLFVGGSLWSCDAGAQDLSTFTGAALLPTFAWPQPMGVETNRWTGSFASVSTGFAASSSKRFGSYAGPTIGFEAGRLWQDGRLVYGIVGGFDYLSTLGGGASLGTSGFGYSRDFAGALHLQIGTLVTPDVLVYAKAGALAVHETLRFGPSAAVRSFTRDDVVLRPDARVGVEWAITDRLTLGVEAGITGSGLR